MDRAPNPHWTDSFSPYRHHAELWTLRIALSVFGDIELPPFQVIHVVKGLMGLDARSVSLTEVSMVWNQAAERLRALEAVVPQTDAPLFQNARALAGYLGLTSTEEETLLLRVMARLCNRLRDVLKSVGECDDHRLAEVIGIALRRPPDDIRSLLRLDSTLLASGLLRLEPTVCDPIERLVPLVGLSGILTRSYASFDEFFGAFVRMAPAATLAPDDFAHLEGKLDLLVAYLASVCSAKSRGRNVLLYGVPGTGKTELARLAASTAALRLYEADVCGDEGQPLGVKGRLHALMFVQRMVHTTPGAIALLDEVEDVFKPNDGPEPDKRTVAAADSKGWTVRLLENNPTPTIWISNRVSQIDAAVLRRFDLAMEVPVPPLAVRRRILERALGSPLRPTPDIERILRDMAPAPALLTRAAQVLSVIRGRGGRDPARDLETIVQGYLAVLGREAESEPTSSLVPFDPKYLNANPAPEAVVAALRGGRAIRLLMHGPSGSGKTAFACHIALQVGVPLVTATVRDLVSEPGWTEHNLRRTFEHARRDGAALLLDHMDWLVWAPFDHRPVQEQKTLDQLFACLDAHSGIVLCTTTRDCGLEPGVVRRFSHRMRFDYLKGNQRLAFLSHALRNGIDEAPAATGNPAGFGQRLSAIGALTPGDIVTVVQQCAGPNLPDPEAMLAALAQGQRLKAGGNSAAMGFLAS